MKQTEYDDSKEISYNEAKMHLLAHYLQDGITKNHKV